jgi:16S rRNA (cytidine1402-2'-O)-methyltransferase
MTGTLFLIPNTLGYNEGQQDGLLAKSFPIPCNPCPRNSVISLQRMQNHPRLSEISRSASPLKLAMQDIQISELNVNTPAQALELAATLVQGHDVGLISEAGVPVG